MRFGAAFPVTSAVEATEQQGPEYVQITKAVITAAGRGARQYPASDTVQKAMLPVVDRDGLTKPVLQIIAEEALESGIEEICVVSAPGRRGRLSRPFPQLRRQPAVGVQGRRVGRGAGSPAQRPRATAAASRFSPSRKATATPSGAPASLPAAQPFLLLLGDHLYLSAEPRRCARQLIDLAIAETMRRLRGPGDARTPDPSVWNAHRHGGSVNGRTFI